jgi:hypothetical protein
MALAFAVYLLTLAPSITFENMGSDSGDLITAARTLGVPHPPGYPTYTLLAWLATQLPIGSIAYRVNLLSACCAALTVGLVFDSARRLLKSEPHGPLLAGAAALTLAFSPIFWSQAVIAEVYALHGLFSALLLGLLLRWRDGGSDALLYLTPFLFGLGLGNHLTLIFFAPAALVLLWPHRSRWLRARILAVAFLLFLVGLSIYVYLPLAARHNPPVNWGNPQTWAGFRWVVLAEQYRQFLFALPLSEIPARLAHWANLLGDQFAWIGWPLIIAGGSFWARRDRALLWFMLAWIVPLSVYAFGYHTGDSHIYLLPAFVLLSILWAGGAGHLLSILRRLPSDSALPSFRGVAWERIARALLILLPLFSLGLHWRAVDRSHDLEALAYAYKALTAADPNSLVIVRGDRATFSLWYAVYAEEYRDDVALVSGPMLAFLWYRAQVRQQYPHLQIPEPGASDDITTDDLVRELIADNIDGQPVYATDPKDLWYEWNDYILEEEILYRVSPRAGGGFEG